MEGKEMKVKKAVKEVKKPFWPATRKKGNLKTSNEIYLMGMYMSMRH